MDRLDRIGRRIGKNWWRDHIVSSWSTADEAWWIARESETIGHATEEQEYAEKYPRPTLKQFMIHLAFKYLEEE